MDKDRLALISLNIEGITNAKDLFSIEQYVGNFHEFWELSAGCLVDLFPKAEEKRKRILAILNKPEKYVETIYSMIGSCQIITILDEDYPMMLKNIYDPPYVLYVNGKLKPEIPLIAMVGARKASAYGKWAASEFSKQLVQFGAGVISGLAYGIDTSSHQGALDAAGYTVSVLGCGVDHIYPASNRKIYEQIALTGAIVSEYPPGTLPQKHYFPARNRIISGLSHGVFVLEAGLKSGSLITAEFAMEQGKEVYALPGHINHGLSHGTNRLIQDGAKMVLKPEDIIDEMFSKQLIQQNKRNSSQYKANLSPKELSLMSLIQEKATSIDELVLSTGLPVSEVNSLVSVLEIKGLIQTLPGKLFTSCR
ncbi:MAG: DNA-protecting protein DprA [Tindallia sp. MSAO_Bac2]|nr:MAG: DNA-protecting protein DprA [Tindallia sp. MSAO_Bac2]